MKKVIYILSAIITVTLLSGCGEKATSKKNIPFTGSDIVDTTDDYAKGFFYSPSFYSLTDYRKYIGEQTEAGNVPEYFMTIEKMKVFGTFRSLVLQPDFEQYYYKFVDKNDFIFDMVLYHSLSEYLKENPWNLTDWVIPASMYPQSREDMRTFGPADKTPYLQFFFYNNIRYSFYNGQLQRIAWYANGTLISMGVDNYYEYPLTSDTFQAKLLNLDTAADAIREHFGEPEPIENFFNQQ